MRLLITAGPTREPIDAVRYISNRSSGRLGIALAQAATQAGHDVTLLLGPVLCHSSLTDRAKVHRFETCAELADLLATHFSDCDMLIMAAAVADYRPLHRAAGKLARGDEAHLNLQLEPTPDLVAAVARDKRDDQRILAFALEDPASLETRALNKMARKGVDAIVANPLGTMESDTITPILLTAGGQRRTPPSETALAKTAFASWLIEQLAEL